MISGDDLWIRKLSTLIEHEKTAFRFLYLLRVGNHFFCSRCGRDSFYERWERRKLVCSHCLMEVSPFSGTMLHRSHISLRAWIEASWIITHSEVPVTAVWLKHQLNLGSYRSAWLLLSKLRKAMEPENSQRMSGVIELDDRVYRGIGRDYDKTVILGALLVQYRGRSRENEPVKRFLKLAMLEDPDEMRMKGFLLDHISRVSRIFADEKKLYMLNWLGLNHYRVWERGEENPPERINKILDQVVSSIQHTFAGIPDAYLPLYLNEIVYRYNHKDEEDRGFLKLMSFLLESREYPLSFFRKTRVKSSFLAQMLETVLKKDEKKPPVKPAAAKRISKNPETNKVKPRTLPQ